MATSAGRRIAPTKSAANRFVGVGTSGGRPRHQSAARNLAALDAGRRSVEPEPQAETAPYAAPTPRSLRRADSTGRFASRLAGATRPERLPDELRRRCDRLGPVPFFGARNHLGGGRFIGSVGASTRHSASVVLRLEKRLQAQADVARSDGRHRARDTVRTHVPGSWTFASSPLRRRKPKAGWSAITGRIKIA